MEKTAEIISYLPQTDRVLKIELAKKIFKENGFNISASNFNKIIAPYLKENKPKDTKAVTIDTYNPLGLSKTQLASKNKYGFYEKDNALYFQTKDGGDVQKSNYIVRPLFHIRSTNETRKLFTLKNNRNQTTIIEVDIESMVVLNKWKIFCETQGNFLFWGTLDHFLRLKQRLYDTTKYCYQVDFLGWQKEGFWAWANGIFADNKFIPTDEYGIVSWKDKNYYIPAFSELYKKDNSVFTTERRFIRKGSDISFKDWSHLFRKVYGDNAMLSVAGLMTAVFSDFIFSILGSLPILNYFGIKGTGKTEHAKSLLPFFGQNLNILNIHKGTEYAAAAHLEYFTNAFAAINEYKNSLDVRKIEYLKSIYNRDGRLRGSIKAGIKTETTQVNSMALLCGQEMPTIDIALFSRLIFMPYYKTSFNKEEKNNFNKLKEIQKEGLTHLTEELLKYRSVIEQKYKAEFYDTEAALSNALDISPDTRLIKNYATILTTFKILSDYVNVSFSYEELFEFAKNRIATQFEIMQKTNEVSEFWSNFMTLVERSIINSPDNFSVREEVSVNLKIKTAGGTETKEFDFSGYQNGCKTILYLKWNTIYNYYAELCARTRQSVMPRKSLEFYLEHSSAFLGRKNPFRFAKVITTAWVFDYDKLNIDVLNDNGTPYDNTDNKYETETGITQQLPF